MQLPSGASVLGDQPNPAPSRSPGPASPAQEADAASALRFGQHTGLILANTVLGAILGLLALKVFAVETGSHAESLLGQLAFAMGLAGLFRVGVDLGLSSAHVKRVSEGRDLGTAVASFAVAKLLLAALFLAITAGSAWLASGVGKLQDTPALAVVLSAVYFAFLELRTIFTATFDGRQEFTKSQLTVLAENLVRVALMILFAVAFAGAVLGKGPLAGWMRRTGATAADLLAHHGAELLVATYAAGALSSLLVAWLQFHRGYPFGRADRAVIRDYWSFGRHILVTAVVGTLYVSFDKVVITGFWAPANTGRYFGAQRISDFIAIVPLAVYTVLFPALSARYARDERGQARLVVEVALRHVSMVVVPLVTFTAVMAAPLLSLVLTGFFEAGVPTLRLLAAYSLVLAFMYPYVTLLNALNRPDVTARAALAGLLVNAGLNLVLVPPNGTIGLPLPGLAERGSALATLVAASVQLIILRSAVHRLEGRILVRHMPRHVVAGAAMAAVLWPLAPGPQDAHWYVTLGLAGLGLAVYLVVLAALREFTRRDLQLYLHLLDPAAMARYVAEGVAARGPAEPASVTRSGRKRRPRRGR